MLSPTQQIMKNINGLRYTATKASSFYKVNKTARRLPLFERPKEEKINPKFSKMDLNDFLIKNPDNTFLIRVQGNSMVGAGINTGDILVVDKSRDESSGCIVVAAINGELLVKRIYISDEGTELRSENPEYKPIKVHQSDEFIIWGVVTSIIKSI